MNYKGDKVWLFGVIPVVYSADGKLWSVDIEGYWVNRFAYRAAVTLLTVWSISSAPVPQIPRTQAKKQPVSRSEALTNLGALALTLLTR